MIGKITSTARPRACCSSEAADESHAQRCKCPYDLYLITLSDSASEVGTARWANPPFEILGHDRQRAPVGPSEQCT
jgi:hypothetical protein